MNILFLCRLFYPHIGGVEKHVSKLSENLLKKGHKITIITEQYSKSLPLKENLGKIQIIRIPNSITKNKFRIWFWFWKNRKTIENADIIHCHDVFYWYLPLRFIYPLKKVYTTFHGYEGYPLRLKAIVMRKITEKLSVGNICVGDFIRKWYKTTPNFVVYGCADRVKNRRIKNENSAVFIGRLDEQTGILTYAEAVSILKKKIPNFRFLAIGDGNLKDKIKGKVEIANALDNASELINDYNFAFVSRYLSIMEAMIARRLVFAVYDNPLKEDYLRMAPFSKYIEIFSSSSELVSKINFYLDNPKAKDKKVREAYSWAKNYTWDKMANTYLRLWE